MDASLFSNVVVPDNRINSALNSSTIEQRISIKLNSASISDLDHLLDIKNENDEQLNDAGIAQLQHLSKEGSLWKMCKEGLIATLKAKLNSGYTFDALNERGTFGESILHVAILYKRTEIAKYLVTKFPEIINAHYLQDEYYGETALHMAVVSRDYPLTEYLLTHGADPNVGRATGRFFDKSTGTVYYGEYALTFAVHTMQTEMVCF